MTKRNSQNIDRKNTQITVKDKCIICSVDVSLRTSGAKTRRNLQTTVPSAASLRETVCLCLSDGEVLPYLQGRRQGGFPVARNPLPQGKKKKNQTFLDDSTIIVDI